MRALLSLALLLTVGASQDGGPGEAARAIDEAGLKAHIGVLASDEYEGRAAGHPGNEKAVEYVVKELKSCGLKPAGEAGGYTQEFSLRDGRKARNVVAVLEGADPRLRSEHVVIGAHLDHVGKAGQVRFGQGGGPKDGDDIWNGADDNASGSSALLVVARAMAAGPARAKRSVLFCWWNAEEAGLVGSRHWVQNPTRPIESLVFNLNLDMVGRNPERPLDLEGVKNAEGEALERIITAACGREGLKITKYDYQNEAMFRSDGASFIRAAIPASMMFSYWHNDYHRVSDHPDRIAYENLAKVSRSALRILAAVADLDERPRFNPNTPLYGKPLGVKGREVAGGEAGEGKGGYKLIEVTEGNLAQRLGLQPGDLILAIGGNALPPARPFAELWKGLGAARAQGKAEIEVLRGGKSEVLSAAWPK